MDFRGENAPLRSALNLYKNSTISRLRDKLVAVEFEAGFLNVFKQMSINGVRTSDGGATFGHITSARDQRESDLKIAFTY